MAPNPTSHPPGSTDFATFICLANQGWTSAQAEAWLTAAGTATNYTGLYDVVREFQPPSPDQLRPVSAEFPETAADTRSLLHAAFDTLGQSCAACHRAHRDVPDNQAHP